ncbi:MAG: hypothetical protein JXA13_04155 [Anaerolineales bacterium]|nr:hypothetical protein [Anaerolineales bacterium]
MAPVNQQLLTALLLYVSAAFYLPVIEITLLCGRSKPLSLVQTNLYALPAGQ